MVETAEPQSVGIRLDPRETTIVAVTDGSVRTRHVPSRLSVTKEGILIGHDTSPHRGQCPIDRAELVDVDGDADEQSARNQPLAVFLSKVCDSVGLREETDEQSEDTPSATGSTDRETSRRVESTVISVPGYYDAGERRSVALAAKAAGLHSPELIRRPTQAIRATRRDNAPLEFDCGELALAVDIDSTCLTVGLYTRSETGNVTVQTRAVSNQLGSQVWRNQLTEAVFERVGQNHNAVVEYDNQAQTDTATAVGQAVRNQKESCIEGDIEVALQLIKGATLQTDQQLLSEKVPITATLDAPLRYSALDSYTDELSAVLQRVLNDTEVTTVDQLILTGEGVGLDAIQKTICDVLGHQDPDHVTRTHPLSYVLPDLSSEQRNTRSVTETTAHRHQVTALEEDGLTPQSLSWSLPGKGASWTRQFKPVRPTQQYGQVVLEWVDPISGTVDVTEPLTITDIPTTDEDVQIQLQIVSHGSGDTSISATAFSSTGPERELTVNRTRVDDGTWLAFADTDTEKIEESGKTHDFTHSHRSDSQSESDLDEEDIAEIVWDIRTALWERGIVSEKALEPQQLESLIREFDQQLSLCGIEFFEPEIGTEANSKKHYIREQRPTDRPEGAIIEVLKPGLVVDDRVVKRADVVIGASD